VALIAGWARVRESGQRDAAARLAEAIRLRTVSPEDDAEIDRQEFLGLHAFLARAFPRVHQRLRREVVGELSLLYTWEGTDSSLNPVLVSAHLDVVPVSSDTEARWTHPPFAGRVVDDHIWGRGALDDKSSVVGVLEAVEGLLADGVRPLRTVYLAFGHDEETGGTKGAARIASLLRSRGVRLAYVLDEGLVVGDGLIPGVRGLVAMIGIAEKGRVVLELTAAGSGGHASMPPRHGAIGALGRAAHRLEAHPMPAVLPSPTRRLLESLASETSLARRIVFSNLWLFGPLVVRTLTRSPGTNALVRTTMAITAAAAGGNVNVLPDRATALMDARVLPGHSVADVVAHVSRVIADPKIEVRTLSAIEPSLVASTEGLGFQTLAATAHTVFPEAIVTPGLVVASTDSKHYVSLAGAVYRFRPYRLTREDLARIHGVDERIAVEDYGRLIAFYARFLLNAGCAPKTPGRGEESQ